MATMSKKQFAAMSAQNRANTVRNAQKKNNRAVQKRQRAGKPAPVLIVQERAQKRKRTRNRRGGGDTRFTHNNAPRMTMKSNFGSRGIRKVLPEFCEQISQPLSSQAWALFKSYSINPGQSSLFPVGSVECQQWQKYRFRYFRVIYEPIVVQFNTNNDAAGEIIIGFDPDASDQPPSSFSQAINMKPVARGRPCDKIVLDIPPSLLHGMLDAHFVRHGGLPGGSDIKTYDVGLVNISVVGSGTTGTTVLGNVFFCYAMDLITQQIALTGAPANNQVAWFQSSAPEAAVSTVGFNAALATASSNGLGIVNTAGSMVPPAGNYNVDFTGEGLNSVNEQTTVSLDFRKNGGSVYTPGNPRTSGVGVAGAQEITVPGMVFVTANGTDAFTMHVALTGATGVLTYNGSVRWTAV